MATTTLIRTRSELDRLFDRSAEIPVFVFKHSLICAASGMARRIYDEFAAGRDDHGALYAVVEIQAARDVSAEIAARTGVRHESPQVLLLRDGKSVWNASHWEISRKALEAAPDGAADGRNLV